ncbi:hypothetical protein FRX31_006210, partial [Thalictrum thalictroides]
MWTPFSSCLVCLVRMDDAEQILIIRLEGNESSDEFLLCEWAKDNIWTTSVAPGLIRTPVVKANGSNTFEQVALSNKSFTKTASYLK